MTLLDLTKSQIFVPALQKLLEELTDDLNPHDSVLVRGVHQLHHFLANPKEVGAEELIQALNGVKYLVVNSELGKDKAIIILFQGLGLEIDHLLRSQRLMHETKVAMQQIQEFHKLAAAKKPKVVKFADGIVICGEFGSEEVDEILDKYGKLPLIVADPPYSEIVKEAWDQKVTADDYIRWTKAMQKHLMKGGAAYVWGGVGKPGNRTFFEYCTRVEKETGMTMANFLTWAKKRFYGNENWGFAREECAYLLNGDKPRIFHIPYLDEKRGYPGFNPDYPAKSEYKRRTNVIMDVSELFSGKIHVAQKPEKLAEIFIETHTNKGNWVMDPFAGSGSTGLAARNLGRKFILIERDSTNFKIICQRLRKKAE